MQTSSIKLNNKSELNINDNEEQNSSQDINQLACSLKNAIFSKYISSYLMKEAEEMWSLYEKKIDRFLKEKHLDIGCDQTRPQTAFKLEDLAKDQQENIAACKRDIEILCSSRKRLRKDDKHTVQLQSTQRRPMSANSIGVPRTPRCIDRYEITSDSHEKHIDEFDDLKRKEIINQETSEFSLSKVRNDFRHCIFKHGEILPFDPNTKTRMIRITYLCKD